MRNVIALVLVCGTAAAQEPAFEALGQVTVVGGDRVRARERALDDALRQAVEQAVASVLDASQVVARSSELRLRIYPRARTYIDNYRILDEGETSGVFQVHVSATVSTGRLARDLAAPAPSPTASKKLRGVVCGPPPVERVAKDALAARNVEIVPAPAPCTEDSAAKTALSAAAQGALVGSDEVSAEGAIRGTDLVAARAKVTLKLIEPGGRVAGDDHSDQLAYDHTAEAAADGAARAAAVEAARNLQPQLASHWPSAAEAISGGVMVTVTGLKRWADYAGLLRALASLPGVAGVAPRRFARGEVDLVVRTASSASQLAAGLDRAPPSGVRVRAAAEGEGALRVEVAEAVEGG
jgi:Flagellar assembly protein T, N-terminal domain